MTTKDIAFCILVFSAGLLPAPTDEPPTRCAQEFHVSTNPAQPGPVTQAYGVFGARQAHERAHQAALQQRSDKIPDQAESVTITDLNSDALREIANSIEYPNRQHTVTVKTPGGIGYLNIQEWTFVNYKIRELINFLAEKLLVAKLWRNAELDENAIKRRVLRIIDLYISSLNTLTPAEFEQNPLSKRVQDNFKLNLLYQENILKPYVFDWAQAQQKELLQLF